MSLLTLLRRRGAAPPPPPPPAEGVPPALPRGDSDSGYPGEPVVRFQPLDGQWETLGVDRLKGLVAQGVVASANDWGPDGFSFQLAAEEGARRPDLLPYTPVELEIGGMLVWSGFVWQRPSDANSYQVACRGWQYHLDDDLFDRVYVHTGLQAWVDARSVLSYDLSLWKAAWNVETGTGGITISHEAIAVINGDRASVVFDAGPDSTIGRVVIGWASSNNDGNNTTAYFDASDTLPIGVSTVLAGIGTGGTSGTYTATLSPPRRYVQIALNANAHTMAGPVWFKILSAQLFRDTAYESGNASILKADTVVKDALTLAPLLNQSAAAISAGTFSLPEYLTGGYVTPRQTMEAVNAVENYRLKIGGGDLRSIVFGPKPTAPIVEVGDWSGSAFSDASVSGEEIYNKAVVDASGPAGERLVQKRGSASVTPVSIAEIDGGTFGGVVTGPDAVGRYASPATIGVKKGVPHRVSVSGGTVDLTGSCSFRIRIGGNAADNPGQDPDDYVEFLFTMAADGTIPAQLPLVWIPQRNYIYIEAAIYILSGTENSMDVNWRVQRGGTLPDRRGFPRARRLDISSAVTNEVAQRLGDLWLTEHYSAPFSGTLQIVGSSARALLSGTRVAPYEFLRHGGEMIRFGNRIDPDTGDWGRDGRIAGATYRHDDRSVEVSIDDQRQRFETILSRYAVLVGG